MEDLAILASIMMGCVLLSGAFALAAAWFDAPPWVVIPASTIAMALGAWWFTIPTAMAALGPIAFAMGTWALCYTAGRSWGTSR